YYSAILCHSVFFLFCHFRYIPGLLLSRLLFCFCHSRYILGLLRSRLLFCFCHSRYILGLLCLMSLHPRLPVQHSFYRYVSCVHLKFVHHSSNHFFINQYMTLCIPCRPTTFNSLNIILVILTLNFTHLAICLCSLYTIIYTYQ